LLISLADMGWALVALVVDQSVRQLTMNRLNTKEQHNG
jgi:hypothetical protein